MAQRALEKLARMPMSDVTKVMHLLSKATITSAWVSNIWQGN